MCGWSERNLECAEALDGDGRAIASASATRSATAACWEYPGVVCAPSGRDSASNAIKTYLVIPCDVLCVMVSLAPNKRPRSLVEMVESFLDRPAQSHLALFTGVDTSRQRMKFVEHLSFHEFLRLANAQRFESSNRQSPEELERCRVEILYGFRIHCGCHRHTIALPSGCFKK